MARTLPPAVETAIAASVTTPVYLIQVDLDTPLYWTTSVAVTWDNQSWLPVGARVRRIDEDRTTLELPNEDNVASALVLVEGVRDRLFTIYEWHASDAVEVFRGYGGDATLDNQQALLSLHRTSRDRASAPRTRVSPPLFTHLPRPGATIAWADTVLTVESQ